MLKNCLNNLISDAEYVAPLRGAFAWVFLCLFAFLISCAGPATQVPLPTESAVCPPVTEDIDTDCSYFYFLWGKTAEVERHYDEAVEAYEKAMVCDESADYVIRRLVVLLARIDKKREALSWINKLVVRHPDDAGTKLLLGNLYAAIGEFTEARKIYAGILSLNPKNTEAMLMLASVYIKEVEYNEALEVLEGLVRIDPDSAVAYRYLAKLYRELNYTDKSLAAYQRALALKWQNSLAMEAAGFYQESEKFDAAVDLYKKVIKDDYINEIAAWRLASLYEKMAEVDKALDLLHELRKSSLEPKKVDLAIGRVLLNQERFDDAVRHYEGMVRLYPDFGMVRSILALAYYEKGDKDKAKEILFNVEKDSEEYRDSLVILLNILRDEGEYDSAITLVQESIAADAKKNDFALRTILADLYEAKGESANALALYKKAIIDFPDEPELYFKFGMFLDGAGMLSKAVAQIEMVLKLDPGNPFALNYIGYTWAEQGVNLDKALEYIEKAIKIKPQDGFIRDSLGWVYFMRGDFAKAVIELQKASLAVPDDPTVMEHYGDALLQDGQVQEALNYYKKSFKLFEKEKDVLRIRDKIKAIE